MKTVQAQIRSSGQHNTTQEQNILQNILLNKYHTNWHWKWTDRICFEHRIGL